MCLAFHRFCTRPWKHSAAWSEVLVRRAVCAQAVRYEESCVVALDLAPSKFWRLGRSLLEEAGRVCGVQRAKPV